MPHETHTHTEYIKVQTDLEQIPKCPPSQEEKEPCYHTTRGSWCLFSDDTLAYLEKNNFS